MENEEIIEGNKLIRKYDTLPFPVAALDTGDEYWYIKVNNYHTDWNRLMAVIEQIEVDHLTIVSIGKRGTKIQKGMSCKDVIGLDSVNWECPIIHMAFTKKVNTWKCVVQYLKQYHQGENPERSVATGDAKN